MTVASSVRVVIRLQAMIALAFFPVLLFWGKFAAVSWVAGVGVVAVGGLLHGLVLRKINEVKFGALAILYLHFVAELAKLTAIFFALLALLIFFRQAELVFVLGGCIAACSAYWLALLIKN